MCGYADRKGNTHFGRNLAEAKRKAAQANREYSPHS